MIHFSENSKVQVSDGFHSVGVAVSTCFHPGPGEKPLEFQPVGLSVQTFFRLSLYQDWY